MKDFPIEPGREDALIIVDVQNDFLPGGSLAVSGGDEVVPAINQLIRAFRAAGRPIFATRDWHPVDHCSFVESGGSWPVHCVQNTQGAQFAPGLEVDDDIVDDIVIVSKASRKDVESYSGFQETDLASRLRECNVKRIYLVGLATDYCVLHTALDGIAEGFEVVVVEEAVRAVNISPDDGEKAIDRMKQEGARILTVEEIA